MMLTATDREAVAKIGGSSDTLDTQLAATDCAEKAAYIAAFESWLRATGRVWLTAPAATPIARGYYDTIAVLCEELDDLIAVIDAIADLGRADTTIRSVAEDTIAVPCERIDTEIALWIIL